MARIPRIQRLVMETFSAQPWMEPLVNTLNQFMDEVVSSLDKDLTLTDNMAAEIRTVEVDGTYPLKLAYSLKRRPVSVLVGDVKRSDGVSITLTDAVFVQWSYNQAGQLQIDNVVGITATSSIKYKLTLEIKAG
jgi:hypothetical protein